MKIEPAAGSSRWASEDLVVDGRVTLDNPTRKQLRMIAAAEAAGAVTVTGASKDERAQMGRHVETDAESLKNQAKAISDGSWLKGSHEAFLIDARIRLDDPDTPADTRVSLEHGVRVSAAYLSRVDEAGHEQALSDAVASAAEGEK